MKFDITIFLTIIFIILKLIGTIHWSWLWVTSPLWIPYALAGLIMIITLIAISIVWIITRIIK